MGINKKWKHGLYLTVALGMLVAALPRLSFAGGWNWATGFSAAWAGLTLLVIAANLHFLLGVDDEKSRALERVRKAKLLAWQRQWSGEPAPGIRVQAKHGHDQD
ncbi:hypothetical protein Q5741_06785 [Paenibacillus sp. JX-17]|uniref:Uncharacterized protein n=1 Tax=Paenibacillus lacisoli TaxID=3064525 RepID=A0ABT9CA43_9BACL|nr:hypothetical protein [Paenibacillus sp. JX-17]MDO7906124.1 hypothetical protein [Paenibacillus sp. JX-17]